MSLKPILVGEHNPYGADPRASLYPLPPSSAGGRLCRLILGMTTHEYLRAFERVDLLRRLPWSARDAFESARRLREVHMHDVGDDGRGRTYVLLGRRVANAFWPKAPMPGYDGERLVAIPHPSGLCRYWLEAGAIDRVRAVLREAGVPCAA